ncbi:MAG: sensor histidine kinase [Lachnospiraceae bacterium]
MKNKLENLIVKNSLKLIIILSAFMVLCFGLCHICVRQSMVKDYNSIVGNAYSEDKQLAEVLAEYLYSDELTEEDALLGRQAMREFGYTSDGMLFAKTYDIRIYAIFYIIIAITFILLIIVIWYHRKNAALALEEEKARVTENVLHSNLGEKQFLDKKNRQTQNYIENVAHQVRTPLTNIMLNINMLYDDQTEVNKAVLDECNYHTERINKLMERLLKIGRLEAGKIIFEKQNENLRVILEKLVNAYPKENRIITDFSDVFLNVDYDWIYEAFKCLMDNSLEHIRDNENVFVSLRQENNKAVIIIEDNGAGFNEEDIPYIFERFYSSNDSHATKHYGIGLNLAKLIIEGHYGSIHAYNRDSQGAAFRIELPQYKLK